MSPHLSWPWRVAAWKIWAALSCADSTPERVSASITTLYTPTSGRWPCACISSNACSKQCNPSYISSPLVMYILCHPHFLKQAGNNGDFHWSKRPSFESMHATYNRWRRAPAWVLRVWHGSQSWQWSLSWRQGLIWRWGQNLKKCHFWRAHLQGAAPLVAAVEG